MPTIAIDCRFAATESGLGRYTRELVSHLVMHEDGIRYFLFVRSTDEDWALPLASMCKIIKADVRHYSFSEQVVIPSLLREYPIDLFFSPHFNVPFSCPVPFIATIHDLILHRFSNDASFLKRKVYFTLFNHTVKHAKRIITVSPFVQSEISAICGEAASQKTRVVTEGVDSAFHPQLAERIDAVRKKYHLQRPYFLYVGNAKQHKNVPMLINAFQKSGRSDVDLVLVTGGKESSLLGPLPSSMKLLSHVEEVDLPSLYCGATSFVTASLYEGFCLPVAEALACGCPVIATNGSAIKDIAAGKALLIEPTVDAFAAAFATPPSRINPIIVGTWKKAAEESAAIFREAMKN